ncbi:hypothetical protein BH20ACT11_BH20ACT11_07590 [soil metagenome]|jgi:hypothetical protein
MSVAIAGKIEELGRGLVADAAEDYLDLSFVAHGIREAFEVSDNEEVLFYTVAVLYRLLDEELLRAGTPTPAGGFEVWEEGPRGTVERILSGWRFLGRAPELGELVWFDATEKGAAYAEDLLAASEPAT